MIYLDNETETIMIFCSLRVGNKTICSNNVYTFSESSLCLTIMKERNVNDEQMMNCYKSNILLYS